MKDPPSRCRRFRKPCMVSPDANVIHGRVWNHGRHLSGVDDGAGVPLPPGPVAWNDPWWDCSSESGDCGRGDYSAWHDALPGLVPAPPLLHTPNPPAVDVGPRGPRYDDDFDAFNRGAPWTSDEDKENAPPDRECWTPGPMPWDHTSLRQGRFSRRWAPYSTIPPRRRGYLAEYRNAPSSTPLRIWDNRQVWAQDPPVEPWTSRISSADSSPPGRPVLKSADELEVFSFLHGALLMSPESVRSNFQEERSLKYQDAWKEAWEFAGSKPRRELICAIRSYTLRSPNVCKDFNAACRRATETGSNAWADFPYKCFWWLLLEAVWTLPEDSEERLWRNNTLPPRLYRGVCDVSVLQRHGDTILFGQFLSTSQTPKAPFRFTRPSNPLLLEFHEVPRRVCREVSLYSFCSHWEVLIVPFCVFRFVGERRQSGVRVVELVFVECLLDRPSISSRIDERFRRSDGDTDRFEPDARASV